MVAAAPSRLKANLLLLLATFIWGTAFVAQRIVAREPVAYFHNGVSFLLAGLVILPFTRHVRPSRAQYRWMLACGTFLFGGAALQQVGLYYTAVANASFLTTLYVVFTPLILFVWFRERPRRLEFLAVALAALGAFLLSTGGHFDSRGGDVLETAGAICWAFHIVLLSKFAARFDSFSFAAGQFLVAGALNLLCGFLFESPAPLLIPSVFWATAYRAVFSVGVCFTIQVWAQRFTTPTEATLIFALESVFAALAGFLLLGEGLAFAQMVGCGFILASAALSQVK